MKLSEHFDSSEFEDAGDTIPSDCLPVFTDLCVKVLEPVRAIIARPIRITSGYRTAEHNREVHGVPASEHVATDRYCAADFTFDTPFARLPLVSVRSVFDWMRENPLLPFHQVILEHGPTGQSIIHVSYNLDRTDRSALEGATHNTSAYTLWPVVPLNIQTGENENA